MRPFQSSRDTATAFALSTNILRVVSAMHSPRARGLEKGVAEHAIRFRSPVKVSHTPVEVGRAHESRLDGGLADAFDHRRKRLLRESFDQSGLARIDVDHSRRDMDIAESGFRQQGV